MRFPGCCNMPTWPSAEQGPAASVNWRSAGLPAVLVPFPQAADQHQEANAACAASLGAAVIVHQHEPDQPVLLNTVQRLLAVSLDSPIQHPILSPRCVKACRPWRNGMPKDSWQLCFRRWWPESSQRAALQLLTQRPHDAAVVASRDCKPIRSQVSPNPSKERQSRSRICDAVAPMLPAAAPESGSLEPGGNSADGMGVMPGNAPIAAASRLLPLPSNAAPASHQRAITPRRCQQSFANSQSNAIHRPGIPPIHPTLQTLGLSNGIAQTQSGDAIQAW